MPKRISTTRDVSHTYHVSTHVTPPITACLARITAGQLKSAAMNCVFCGPVGSLLSLPASEAAEEAGLADCHPGYWAQYTARNLQGSRSLEEAARALFGEP